ncbi:hypothetical protein, partial [Bartonella sp. CL63NXGY]|uniref:hypothetical protein n=1 Tax=Bartonella sp. CL63NXGY TaxID=3243538 RepID=UPI0035CF2F3A
KPPLLYVAANFIAFTCGFFLNTVKLKSNFATMIELAKTTVVATMPQRTPLKAWPWLVEERN